MLYFVYDHRAYVKSSNYAYYHPQVEKILGTPLTISGDYLGFGFSHTPSVRYRGADGILHIRTKFHVLGSIDSATVVSDVSWQRGSLTINDLGMVLHSSQKQVTLVAGGKALR